MSVSPSTQLKRLALALGVQTSAVRHMDQRIAALRAKRRKAQEHLHELEVQFKTMADRRELDAQICAPPVRS